MKLKESIHLLTLEYLGKMLVICHFLQDFQVVFAQKLFSVSLSIIFYHFLFG